MSDDNNVIRFPGAAPQIAGRRLIPAKLRAARRARRLSQVDLATEIGVSRQAVSAYEMGTKLPEPQTMSRVAAVLHQPMPFFFSDSAETFGPDGPKFFRKYGADTIRRNEASDQLAEWLVHSAKYLDSFVNYPKIDLPEFSPEADSGEYTFEEIQAAAEACRKAWGLGVGPISNVSALLESKGVTIAKHEMPGENVEAFSFWNGHRPFILMASEKESGARIRFDLAHEVGHLVLHKSVEREELEDRDRLKQVEKEANWFAGAFLLPRVSFSNEVYSTRLDSFLPLKLRWRVSIQAMIYRCSDLGLLDPDQVLNLRKSISYRKWRSKEPYDDPKDIPLEEPRLLRRALEMVLKGGLKHPSEVVNDICLNPRLLERFFALPEGALNEGRTDNVDLIPKW